MENKTPKAIWQKPEIIDLDMNATNGVGGAAPETPESIIRSVIPLFRDFSTLKKGKFLQH